MIEVLKVFFENMIDTIVISFLFVVCIILVVLALVLFPIKRARIFIGHQMKKIADTMDYFLDNSGE